MANPEQSVEWLPIAVEVARELEKSAARRDREGGTPQEEIGLLRDTGLLTLLVPARYGGGDGNWELGYRVIREIAKADGSVAHLLGYHYHFAELLRFFGSEEQRARNLLEATTSGWFLGWRNQSARSCSHAQ